MLNGKIIVSNDHVSAGEMVCMRGTVTQYEHAPGPLARESLVHVREGSGVAIRITNCVLMHSTAG